ncbi:MAG: SDR family oxidoreductase [Acidobacteriota bacterium]
MSERDPFDFSDQVVVVTGSSSGIGEAIARACVARGARVVVNSSSSVEAGTALAEELGDAAIYRQGDISKEEDGRAVLEGAAAQWGRIDHLVNNAGTTAVIPHHDFDALTEDVWRRILDVNLLGTFFLSRLALPYLRETKGSIVNVTSLAGVRQVGSSIPYSVSKAALNHLTKLMANQVGPEVRVNALAPGLIETPWTAEWDEAHEQMKRAAPLQRSGTSEDMAAACIGLMASPYTTGAVLLSDGGVNLRG